MGGLFDKFLLDDEPPARSNVATYDDDEEYFTLQDKKLEQEIRKLKIQNEKELRSLVEKSLVVSIMGEIGQSLQNNFVDCPKRYANQWANSLGLPSKERDIEKMISDMVESGINGVINDIERLSQKGVWE